MRQTLIKLHQKLNRHYSILCACGNCNKINTSRKCKTKHKHKRKQKMLNAEYNRICDEVSYQTSLKIRETRRLANDSMYLKRSRSCENRREENRLCRWKDLISNPDRCSIYHVTGICSPRILRASMSEKRVFCESH